MNLEIEYLKYLGMPASSLSVFCGTFLFFRISLQSISCRSCDIYLCLSIIKFVISMSMVLTVVPYSVKALINIINFCIKKCVGKPQSSFLFSV